MWRNASEPCAFASDATAGSSVRPRRGLRRGVRRGARELELEQHVGALVLDRLERADRPAELHARLRVVDRHLEQPLRAADHLARERGRRLVERLRERAPRRAPASPSSSARAPSNVIVRELARRIDRASGRRVTPFAFARSVKNERPSRRRARARAPRRRGPRCIPSTTNDFSPWSVQAVRCWRASSATPVRVPAPVRLGDRERRERLAARDARQERRLLRLVARVQDRVRRQHRPTRSTARRERAAHLLEHDAELDEAEALPAVRLGNLHARQRRAPARAASRPRARSPRASPSAGASRRSATWSRGIAARRGEALPVPR